MEEKIAQFIKIFNSAAVQKKVYGPLHGTFVHHNIFFPILSGLFSNIITT